ncbi:MAG: ABC transporter permease subunit [Myxococcales bacterium]|nr:ABC transporter permease subunit [Myxococcales bacterium]
MTSALIRRRRTVDAVARGAAAACVVLLLAPTAIALTALVTEGARGIVGAGGWSVVRACAGTLMLAGIASAVAIPLGVGGGLYINEYRGGTLARAGRWAAGALSEVPAVVIGLAVHALLVAAVGRFSFLWGAAALALMIAPTMAHTTADAARSVPESVREAAIALGASRWRTTLFVVSRVVHARVARAAWITAARAAGATAPLLFMTEARDWPRQLTSGDDALPLQVFDAASRPDARAGAWAAALVLVTVAGVMSYFARRAATPRGHT